MTEVLESFPDYAVPSLEFEDLYRREYPTMIGVAHALTGGSHTAEDLVQDTMVKAYLNWPKVSRYQRPGAWCIRVLTNACGSWRRRRRVADRYLAGLRRAEPVTDGPSGAYAVFWDAVRRLPARPRLVVVLFYVGDRPVAEIASILKVPEGTVKSDLARSRVVLMAELER